MNNRRPETQPICLLAFACYIIWCAPVEGTSVALWGKRALIGANTTYVFPNETGAAYIPLTVTAQSGARRLKLRLPRRIM